jgi:hypothetical protein
MVERDGSILSIGDLPIGWGADREFLGAEWTREANPEPDEEAVDDSLLLPLSLVVRWLS